MQKLVRGDLGDRLPGSMGIHIVENRLIDELESESQHHDSVLEGKDVGARTPT